MGKLQDTVLAIVHILPPGWTFSVERIGADRFSIQLTAHEDGQLYSNQRDFALDNVRCSFLPEIEEWVEAMRCELRFRILKGKYAMSQVEHAKEGE